MLPTFWKNVHQSSLEEMAKMSSESHYKIEWSHTLSPYQSISIQIDSSSAYVTHIQLHQVKQVLSTYITIW